MIELVLVVTVVILVSAFCSTCEAALYSVPESHVESLVTNDSPAGKILRALREKIEQPITAILSLNTIANTAGAAVAGALAARALGSEWLIAFSAAFTVAILLFSEVIPKTVGVVYCRPVSTLLARPMQLLVLAFKPIIWICSLATRIVAGNQRDTEVSTDEIVIMARLGLKSGSIDKEELDVIHNIIAIRDRTVRDVMTPRSVVFSLDATMTIEEASKTEGVLIHSRIPVFVSDPSELVGIAYRRDILRATTEGKSEGTLQELMKPISFISGTTTLDDLLERFLKYRKHIFVVLNEFDETSGIITLEDVLEEVLGSEIVDEFDVAVDMQELARNRRAEVIQNLKKPGKGAV